MEERVVVGNLAVLVLGLVEDGMPDGSMLALLEDLRLRGDLLDLLFQDQLELGQTSGFRGRCDGDLGWEAEDQFADRRDVVEEVEGRQGGFDGCYDGGVEVGRVECVKCRVEAESCYGVDGVGAECVVHVGGLAGETTLT